MLNINIRSNTYITSIQTILKANRNSTKFGCFKNLFNNNDTINCFKSYILTPVLCANFCSLTGNANKKSIISL